MLTKLKNGELKTQLILRVKPVWVNKNALQERLQKSLADNIPVGFEKEKTKTQAAHGVENLAVGKIFSASAHWYILTQNEDSVEEPSSPTFANPCAPTILEKYSMHVPVKHNFSTIFERPTFKVKMDKIKTYASGIFKIKSDGTPYTEKVQRDNSGLDPKFIKKYIITLDS